MLPIDSKPQLMYHHNSIGGTRPSLLGIHYKVKTVQGDGIESQQNIFVKWFSTLKFEANLAAHELAETAWESEKELVGKPKRFLSLSSNTAHYILDMFAKVLETNKELHPKLQLPHDSPYGHMRRFDLRHRDFADDEHFIK